MQSLSSLIAGFIFALGLGISGMTNPMKVKAFLDLSGNWDPSLIFVMVGGIAVYSTGYFFLRRKEKPFLGPQFIIPKPSAIDRRLLLGSGVFGIGWGISGFCPGPALSSLGAGSLHAPVFVSAMLIAMIAFAKLEGLRASKSFR